MSAPIKVDDSDPSIEFFGSWVLGGSTHEYNGTTHGALTNGSGFNFNFTGVSVSVIATVAITPAGGLTDVVTFNLDDLEAVIVAAPQTGAAIYNYNYFTSPTTLENGNHQLIVTGIRIGGPDISGFWFDYLEYSPGAVSTTRAPAPSSETSISTSSVSSESASSDPLLPTTAISPPATSSSAALLPSSTAPKTILGSSSSSATNTSPTALAAASQNSTSVGSLPSSTAASSSSPSTIPSPNALDGHQKSANNNRHIIPAIVGSVCAFAVLVAGALWLLHYKKRRAYSAPLSDLAAARLDGDAQEIGPSEDSPYTANDTLGSTVPFLPASMRTSQGDISRGGFSEKASRSRQAAVRPVSPVSVAPFQIDGPDHRSVTGGSEVPPPYTPNFQAF